MVSEINLMNCLEKEKNIMKRALFFQLFILLITIGFFINNSFAEDGSVFGPKKYLRSPGSPNYYSDTFLAQPGEGLLIIKNGSYKKKSKRNRKRNHATNAVITVNGVRIFGPRDFKKKAKFLQKKINLLEENTISVKLGGRPGSYLVLEVKGNVGQYLPAASISAVPTSIFNGESSVLTWSSTNAETCVIEPGIGEVNLNGSVTVSPIETTTYTITATGSGGVITSNTTITLQNSPPTATDQSIITDEDISIPVILTGSDPDNDTIIYEIIVGPTSGTLNGAIPNLTYNPGSNYSGGDSFTFKTNDGQIDSAPATIALTVNPVNDVPNSDAGSDQEISRTETVTLNGNGSSDIDGDTLTYQWSFASLPSGSTAGLSDSSNVTPSFIADVSGVYDLELIVNDGDLASSPDTVTITVSPRMVTIPFVVNLTRADAEAAITTAGLLVGTTTTSNSDTVPVNSVINQSPASGALIVEGSVVDLVISIGSVPTVSIVANPESIPAGETTTLTWSSTNAATCTIESGVGSVDPSGSTVVSPVVTTVYTITVNGIGGSSSSTVTVTVNPLPTVTIIPNPNAIFNGESSVLTWSSTNAETCVIEPGIGEVNLNGSVTVSPIETTTYTITVAGSGGVITANATITLQNSPPTAVDQSIITDEDTTISLTLAGSDPDNDIIIYEIIAGPASGTLSGTMPNLTYNPDSNYSGVDSFTFKTNDGQIDSAPATITLTVNPVNDVPYANAGSDQEASRTETVTLNGSGSSDIDGDTLTYQWSFASLPAGSTAGLSDSSNVTPSFIADVSGVYELELIVNDGNIASSPDAVTITVSPLMVTVPSLVNLPQADAEAAISAAGLAIGTTTTSNSETVPANSVISQSPASGVQIVEGSVVDLVLSIGSVPTVSIVANPESIPAGETTTLTWSSTNAATCTIEPGVGSVDPSGSTVVSPAVTTVYTITVNGIGGSSSSTVTVTVNPLPTVTIIPNPVTIFNGQSSVLTWGSSNVDTCTIEPGIGSVDLNSSITVSPTETTTYTITASGPGGVVTADTTITLQNSAPTAGDQSLTTNEDVATPVTLTGSDPDNDVLSYEIITGPTAGTLSGTVPNLIYTPNNNYNGGDSFTFKTNDGQTDSTSATITLTVEAVNDVPTANAGSDQTRTRTQTVILDGSGSNDIDGDTLTYQWSLVSVPSGSTTTLSNSSNVNSSFIADVSGVYELELIVNDGNIASAPDTVTITASPRMVAVPSLINLPQLDAQAAITSAGLVLGIITTANSDTVPLNAVISQNPVSGTQIVEGSVVDLVLSIGSVPINLSVTIHAAPESILVGESTTLTWSSTMADMAFIEPDVGSVAENGTLTITPDHTTTYTITATGPDGSTSSQVTVTVIGTPALLPEGSFGEQYSDIIPSDATIESYDSKRFSLITGEVYDLSGNPISDVCVSVFNSPEYGTVKTDVDGRFSIPVEGGGTLNLLYQKEEYLTVHRQVDVPWNEIAVAETIAMIIQDSAATTFTFDGNSDTIITHQSTLVVDESGSRSATMVFSGDNHVYLVDELGNDVHELTTITTRATEFVIPESMPAKLPPNSAFTYCSELSVDGAQRVRFEKPVITWVDNFLGFDVGEIVPVGYYDRDLGAWVPSDNGMVVKLLDTDADGIVDALDSDGDDQPNDLDNNGSFSDEVAGLNDSGRYQPNTTFWRVEITHFTPWDCNWPYAPPLDAISPNPLGLPMFDQKNEEAKDCSSKTGSYVNERSRIFNEDIAIPGTNMDLHYSSNRVEGYKNVIRIPVSGDSLPQSLKRIIVRLKVAGQTFEQTLDALPNQSAEFVWDGLDHFGRPVVASKARASVGFEYDLFYTRASGVFAKAFAQVGDNITGVRGRRDMVSWKHHDISVNGFKQVTNSIAEGWTLSAHHNFSTLDPSTLYKGNGSILKNTLPIIDTVAGNGSYSHDGDGGKAIDAGLYDVSNVIPDAKGGYYIMEYWEHFIRYVDADGNITIIAGTGIPGYNGDGIPAVTAQIYYSWDAAVDNAGNLYITDLYNHRIRKIDQNGIISTIAGTGTPGYTGDGWAAKQAQLSFPFGIDVDTAGNIYFGSRENHVIRKIDPGGIITTIAGNGTDGDGGDGGAAIQAHLGYPRDIVVDESGNLYISQDIYCKVRKVGTDGIISTIAGSSDDWEYSGDGGPATSAELAGPDGLAIDKQGNLYISDSYNYRIRKVDPSGIISTIAGIGEDGYAGDGGPAISASTTEVFGIALDPAGNLYLADSWNWRIRKIDFSGAFTSLMAPGEVVFTEGNGLGHVMSNAGLHKKTIDLETGTILREFMYNENNLLISIVDQFGNQITINRDENGVPISITSPDGFTTQLIINANNHLDHIIYPDNSDYNFVYSSDGLLESKIEPKGNRFDHIFDGNGRLTDATDDEGGHWQFDRSVLENGDILTAVLTGEGNLSTYQDHTDSTGAYTSTITDPTGSQSIFTESSDGLLVEKSLSCGMNLSIKYDLDSEYKFKFVKQMTESTPADLLRITLRDKTYLDTNSDEIPDQITETVSVNGKVTTLEKNVLQSQKVITSPEGRIITMSYNPNTLVTESVSVPNLFDTSYDYDSKGRLISLNTNTRGIDYTYNDKGFLESVTDPESNTTIYGHDAVGRVTSIDRSDGSSLGFTYDDNGNITMLTNPSLIGHGFGSNNVNMKSSYSTPLSGSYSYLYDKDRQLKQVTFPSGDQINNIYTGGRLELTQTPEGNIDYTYSCSSKIDSISKNGESIAYTYDGKLLTSETLTGSINQTIGFNYNDDFNAINITYAGGTENITYDNDGLLTGLGNYIISRNAQNGLPEAVTGGSLSIARGFNGYGELDSQNATIGSQNVSSWDLTRDDNGRITSKTETIDGTIANFIYGYDSMRRLLTVTKDGVLVEEYSYSLNGSREYEMNTLKGIVGRALSYSDGDHLLNAGTSTYQYDLDGFLTRKDEGTNISFYNYSSRGELLSVTQPDSTLIEYDHDPMARRITKKVNGEITQKYLWQGLTRLLAIYDGADNLVQRFEYADGRMPVSMTQGASRYYLTFDQVGSLRLVADASGNVVKRIDYDTFGSIISDSNPGFKVPFGFAGGLYDNDTGLVRFGYRDYDPNIGRWTAKDPIGFAGGDTDLYGYVLNDPVNFIDPEGLYKAAPYGDSIGYDVDYGGPGSFNSSSLPSYKDPAEIVEDPAIRLTAGIVAIAGGAATGNGPVIALGIGLTAEGGALQLAKSLGGEVSKIPYDYGLFKGIYDALYGKDEAKIKPCP